MPTGIPSLNSSIAIMAALQNPKRRSEIILLAITDNLANLCVLWYFTKASPRHEDNPVRQESILRKALHDGYPVRRESILRKSRDFPLLVKQQGANDQKKTTTPIKN